MCEQERLALFKQSRRRCRFLPGMSLPPRTRRELPLPERAEPEPAERFLRECCRGNNGFSSPGVCGSSSCHPRRMAFVRLRSRSYRVMGDMFLPSPSLLRFKAKIQIVASFPVYLRFTGYSVASRKKSALIYPSC